MPAKVTVTCPFSGAKHEFLQDGDSPPVLSDTPPPADLPFGWGRITLEVHVTNPRYDEVLSARENRMQMIEQNLQNLLLQGRNEIQATVPTVEGRLDALDKLNQSLDTIRDNQTAELDVTMPLPQEVVTATWTVPHVSPDGLSALKNWLSESDIRMAEYDELVNGVFDEGSPEETPEEVPLLEGVSPEVPEPTL